MELSTIESSDLSTSEECVTTKAFTSSAESEKNYATPKEANVDDGPLVQITKDVIENDKKMTVVDIEAVEKVFGRKDIVNSPVAIYCIAGMFRGGKSFFLNLVNRYLKFKDKRQTESWLNDKKASLKEGFHWKAGSELDTKGILIWNEPIWFETKKHGKVAVFLMDTQGTEDDSSSKVTEGNLFSLSTLLSSYHIYNMKWVMNRGNLDLLKTFTDFEKKMKTKEDELHQLLLFLLRDWQDDDFEYGFEGGSKYLDKTFNQIADKSDEYKMLCDNIRSSFKEVKCALLPHPGTKIIRKKTTGTLEDIDDEFLTEVQGVLNHMFTEICVKQIGEYPLTGEDIINQAIVFSHQAKTKPVDADMLFNVVSHSFLANLVGRCEAKFTEGAKSLSTSHRSKSDLDEFHKDLVKEVLTYFDNKMKVTSEDKAQKCRDSLEKSLEERIFVLRNINDVSEQGIEEEYRTLVNQILSIFKEALDIYFDPEKRPKVILYIGKENFEDIVKHKETLAIKSFKDTTSQEKFPDEIYSCYLQKLKNELSLQKKLYESMNYILLCQVEKEILKAAVSANDKFIQDFKMGIKKHDDCDEKWFAILEEISIASYRSSNVSWELSEFKSGAKKLKEDISRRARICKQRIEIEQAGRDAGTDAVNLISEMKRRFSECIKEAGRDAGTDAANLISEMKRGFSQCIKEDSMLDNSKADKAQKYQAIKQSLLSKIPEDLKEDCSGMISRLCDNLVEENEFEDHIAKDKFLLELLTVKLEVATKLHEFLIAEKKPSLFQKIFSNESSAVLEQLETKKVELMKSFRKAGQDAEGKRRNLSEQVKVDLNKFFTDATTITREQVAVQKECDKEVAQKIRKILIVRYAQQMEEMIKKTKAKKRKLKEIHDVFLSEYNYNVKKKFGKNSAALEAVSSFKIKMDAELKQWIAVNRFHKTIYPRELGRWAEIKLRIKNKFESWWAGDAANKRVMKASWLLPTKFAEISAKIDPRRKLKDEKSIQKTE